MVGEHLLETRKLFLVILTSCVIFVIAIVVYSLVSGEDDRCSVDGDSVKCPLKYTINKSITVFALLGFQMWFAVSGILTAWRLFGSVTTIRMYDAILFGGVVVFQIAMSIVLHPLLKEHRWRQYRKVGTDPELRTMYQRYLILICTYKILLLLAIINGTSSGDGIFDKSSLIVLDIIYWITALVFTILGWASYRYELKFGTIGSLLVGTYTFAYVTYWFVTILREDQVHSPVYALRALAVSFLATGSITVILTIASAVLMILQYVQYGTGFLDIFDKRTSLPRNDAQVYSGPVSLFGTVGSVEQEEDDLSDLDVGIRSSFGREGYITYGIGTDQSMVDDSVADYKYNRF